MIPPSSLTTRELESEEQDALSSLLKLKSSAYHQNQLPPFTHPAPAPPLNQPPPANIPSNISPIPLKTLTDLQTALKSTLQTHTSLLTHSLTLTQTTLTLHETLSKSSLDLRMNASILTKLTQSTRALSQDLQSRLDCALKSLERSLEDARNTRFRLMNECETLHGLRYTLEKTLSRDKQKAGEYLEESECIQLWIHTNCISDIDMLARALTKMTKTDQALAQALDTNTSLHAKITQNSITSTQIFTKTTHFQSMLTTHLSTSTSLHTYITLHRPELHIFIQSLPGRLHDIQSQVREQVELNRRLGMRLESLGVAVEGCGVYVKGVQMEVEGYREDLKWISEAISKVEAKIRAAESTILPVKPESTLLNHEVRNADLTPVEISKPQPVLDTISGKDKYDFKLPRISTQSVVTYSSSPVLLAPTRSHTPTQRTHALPPIQAAVPAQTQSFKWDQATSKSAFLTNAAFLTNTGFEQTAIKTYSRPTSSSSMHSLTSNISGVEGFEERGWSALKARHRYTH